MKHFSHYLVLIIILATGIAGLWFFRFHPLRPLIVFGLPLAYLVWGIIHHALIGHLHRKVVLEYFTVALLGWVLISIIL